MAIGREGKLEMSRYLSKSIKTDDFSPLRTLSGSFHSFGIYREQTNKHSQFDIYYIILYRLHIIITWTYSLQEH